MSIVDWSEREEKLVAFELRDGLLGAGPLVEVLVFDISEAPRGFSALLPETQRVIAAKGGRNCQASGLAHRWDKEAARKAGKKGGEVVAGRLPKKNKA